MNRKFMLIFGLTAVGLVSLALAEQMDHSQMDHSKMDMQMEPNASDPPSTKAFIEANARMHKEMSIKFSGDAGIDFIKGMKPHHEGAVEMAKIVLQYGKDPDVHKLAEDIIKAQNTEIAWMTDWLAKHAK